MAGVGVVAGTWVGVCVGKPGVATGSGGPGVSGCPGVNGAGVDVPNENPVPVEAGVVAAFVLGFAEPKVGTGVEA